MEHNLQTFNELQTFLALDNTVKSEIMMYRAKITNIQEWVDEHYDSYYIRVRDSRDVYLEVRNETEADVIEQINTLQGDLDKYKLKLACFHCNVPFDN